MLIPWGQVTVSFSYGNILSIEKDPFLHAEICSTVRLFSCKKLLENINVSHGGLII